MELNPVTAAEIARDYIGSNAPLARLGWGIGGFVYLSPDGRTAVKVHRGEEGFTREVEVYQRIRRLRITEIHDVVIPKLHDFRPDLRLIRIDFVVPPFLVDFAGASFRPPDFPSDTMEQWHAGLTDMFGPNVHLVYAVYSALSRHGIWYTDFRPSNLKLEGHPEYQQVPEEDLGDTT
jgi:hypothetical protein